MNLVPIERENPLWKDNLVHRLFQAWSRQTHLWMMIVLHIKIFYCKDIENELKVITTRQIEQNLYWCTIPYYSWSRKVFHDERHWGILTIHRFSGLSWVHLAKRRRFIWIKRWIRGNATIGPVLEVTTCCLQGKKMEWKSELSLWTKTILTRGSEFLTAWMNWSRTRRTRTKTTTSRKPQKCSSKNMR